MMKEPFLVDFDSNSKAVLEPNHDQKDYHFPKRLLYAFVPDDSIQKFLQKYQHKVIGEFLCISFNPKIYEIKIAGERFTLCQAPLGAPAATQLLDWLIAYGVKQVLAIGSAGVLTAIPENYFLVPTKAIRDEGTSFHYLARSNYINLQSTFLTKVEKAMKSMHYKVEEIMTWTTDGSFRETPAKVQQSKKLGASTVETECAAMAACAQFRHVDFAQILFTADSLNDLNTDNERDWGVSSQIKVMNLAINVLKNIH
ncbi:nucleoside phosphorylase [Lactobacillus acetotolerans]|uniref:nucleoside phosphorylase n=1 Tax=Lactobacillus acetotolerans TaxID=1600 RepID=UPI0019D0C9FD|nr:nucleoside phosphorylase [Lactobacillus acetotolerans]MBN7276682.1 phosphorylase [Lactobacillus acetotolerans]